MTYARKKLYEVIKQYLQDDFEKESFFKYTSKNYWKSYILLGEVQAWLQKADTPNYFLDVISILQRARGALIDNNDCHVLAARLTQLLFFLLQIDSDKKQVYDKYFRLQSELYQLNMSVSRMRASSTGICDFGIMLSECAKRRERLLQSLPQIPQEDVINATVHDIINKSASKGQLPSLTT